MLETHDADIRLTMFATVSDLYLTSDEGSQAVPSQIKCSIKKHKI